MRRLARAALAIALATATGLAGYAVTDAEHADASTVLGPGLVTVTVSIRYSHFSMSTLKVHTGSTVRFLIRNDDPITHEFIVGDAAVHARHEHGTLPAALHQELVALQAEPALRLLGVVALDAVAREERLHLFGVAGQRLGGARGYPE